MAPGRQSELRTNPSHLRGGGGTHGFVAVLEGELNAFKSVVQTTQAWLQLVLIIQLGSIA